LQLSAGGPGCELPLASMTSGPNASAGFAAGTWLGQTKLASGGAKITGGPSSTMTLCVAVAVLPDASRAVYVITVVPTGKKLPAGTPVRVTFTVQLSVAVGVPNSVSPTTTPQAPTASRGVEV